MGKPLGLFSVDKGFVSLFGEIKKIYVLKMCKFNL